MSISDPRYARDISYPFRYDADCDVALDENEQVIEQSLILIVFTQTGTVVLFREFGCDVEESVFDQLDDAMELAMDTSIRLGIENFEDRVILDRNPIFDEYADSNRVLVILPITLANTGQQLSVKIPYPRPGMRSV